VPLSFTRFNSPYYKRYGVILTVIEPTAAMGCAVFLLVGISGRTQPKLAFSLRHRTRSAELTPNCFIVHDADGQQLAYVHYESEPGRRSAAKLLTPI
jgi:hypothetical protein